MILSTALEKRSENKCELCQSDKDLTAINVAPKSTELVEDQIAVCSTCKNQIEASTAIDENHWRCLNDSIWNPEPAVQVMAYRMLTKLGEKDWAMDLKNTMYMDDTTREWAEAGLNDEVIIHKDSNGNILIAGDTVTLIQDLNVKRAGFTAKRGIAVRRIRLVHDNAEHIEGKIEGQSIVILTKYVKKS